MLAITSQTTEAKRRPWLPSFRPNLSSRRSCVSATGVTRGFDGGLGGVGRGGAGVSVSPSSSGTHLLTLSPRPVNPSWMPEQRSPALRLGMVWGRNGGEGEGQVGAAKPAQGRARQARRLSNQPLREAEHADTPLRNEVGALLTAWLPSLGCSVLLGVLARR